MKPRNGAIDEQTAAWQAETTELEQREANARAELDRMRADVEAAQAALAEERQQWEATRTDASDVRSTAAGLIAARQAELEAAQRLIDEQSAALRAETAEHARRDAEVRADLERAQAEVASMQAAFADERRQWELHRRTRTRHIRRPPSNSRHVKPSLTRCGRRLTKKRSPR